MQEKDMVQKLEMMLAEDARRLTEPLDPQAVTGSVSLPDFTTFLAKGGPAAPAGTTVTADVLTEALASPSLPSTWTGTAMADKQAWWRPFASPLLSVLSWLPGSGQDSPAESLELPRFELPESRSYSLGFERSSAELFEVERNAEGSPRRVSKPPQSAETNISIEVTAMDSQSFLDRRNEIADAVRLALLESHRLKDTLDRED